METATVDTDTLTLDQILREFCLSPESLPKSRRLPSPESLRLLLRFLVEYGFQPSDLRKIVRQPSTFCHKKEYAIATFSALERQGCSRQTVLKMVIGFPTIMNATPERIDETFEILRYLEMDPSSKPGAISWSPALLRGRVAFLQQHPDEHSHWTVFLTKEKFLQKFGVGDAELIALDPGREAFRCLTSS